MKAILLDTHAWAWSIISGSRLSPQAASALADAGTIYVSPVSLYEIGQKVRLGKWPAMAPEVELLSDTLKEQGGMAAPLDPSICLAAGNMVWDHRDPFDRILAATALHLGVPIISADAAFDGIVTRIW